MRAGHLGSFVLLTMLLALVACEDDPVTPSARVVSDFSLIDVNPNSGSHGEAVSPRKYVGSVSAWYFGHAT